MVRVEDLLGGGLLSSILKMEGERCVREDREGERQRTGCCVLSNIQSAIRWFLFVHRKSCNWTLCGSEIYRPVVKVNISVSIPGSK